MRFSIYIDRLSLIKDEPLLSTGDKARVSGHASAAKNKQNVTNKENQQVLDTSNHTHLVAIKITLVQMIFE